jgi:phospholipase C
MPLRDIETIVFVMQENRSFDHALGYLSTSAAGLAPPLPVDGLRDDPAWLDAHAEIHAGRRYPIHAFGPEVQQVEDPPHDHAAIAVQIGTPSGPGGPAPMNGFVASYMTRRPPPADPAVVMGHYTAAAVPVFDFFARNFAVCDHWFAALPTGTQANRLMAMGGHSAILDNAAVFLPEQPLVYDWLTTHGVPWCAYQWGGFFPFFSLMPRWLPEMVTSLALSEVGGRGRFRRYARLREHWMDDAAPIPSVIFVEPEYTDGPHRAPNDDHPPSGIAKGQALLADLYATLIANPRRWRNTMLIVTYDEHGGFFDHVPPLPIGADVGGHALGTTGVRVPAFVVSPHVAPGVPFPDALDHTSFLQLLADRFNPGQGYSAEVSARQARLGRLATVLTRVPSGPVAGPALPPTATLGPVTASAAAPTSSGTADSASAARTARAFHNVAMKVAADHPDLLGASGWSELAAYVAAQKWRQ